MDSPAAFRVMRSRGRAGLCHGGVPRARSERIVLRRVNLAGEFWDNRKRPADRDRSALRFPSGVGPDLLAQLVARKSIGLAHLDGALDFSWARDSGEGSGALIVLLRSRRVRSGPRTGTPEASWPSSLRGSSYND